MNSSVKNPVLVEKDLLKPSAKVFSEAFYDDPFISYVFPDLEEKKLKSAGYWYLTLRYAHLYGQVYSISNDLEGVAVWLPSEKLDFSVLRTIRSGNYKLPMIIGYSAFKRLARCVHGVIAVQKQIPGTDLMNWAMLRNSDQQ